MQENYASLYTYITSPPEIRIEISPDGIRVPKAALLTGLTCRIPHKGPDGEVEAYKWDRVLVCSFNSSFIGKYLISHNDSRSPDVSMGDMIIIEGKVRVKDKEKTMACPNCGFGYTFLNATVYIEPSYLYVCERNVPENEAVKRLITSNEASNIVHFAGDVSGNPEFQERDGRESAMLSLCIHGSDDCNIKSRWVKSFGRRTREYSSMIHDESNIYISGSLQTRIREKTIVCENCKKEFLIQTASTMLVPYRIEPVKNCTIPDLHG